MSEIFGNKSAFMACISTRDDARELSESKYNLLIGAMLTWGFLVNFVIVKLATPALIKMIYTDPSRYPTFMIGFLVAYFILVMAGSAMVRSYDPVRCFIGYNLIALPIGVLLTVALMGYDPALIARALMMTTLIALIMMLISSARPELFMRIGGGLAVGLGAAILVELVSLFFFRGAGTLIDFAVVALMSLYIGFDWVRANTVQRSVTNAIAASSALYLDIVNIFLRLLRILARSRRRD